jgi:hypothetical protein
MPRVASPAIIHSPRMESVHSMQTTSMQAQSQPQKQPRQNKPQTTRLQPNDMDEKVKDKSCGCCVIM